MWQGSIPALQWLRAFSEAGIAGAIAGWYAVVALFRHPLGVPVPHTAIIPINKDRIADSIGAFIETHFLTPQNVVERLVRFDLAATPTSPPTIAPFRRMYCRSVPISVSSLSVICAVSQLLTISATHRPIAGRARGKVVSIEATCQAFNFCWTT
jgi:hypothetical protein